MITIPTAAFLGLVLEPPLDPDRNEARRWAAEELADARYREAVPGLLEEWWRQFIDWLRSLNSGEPWAGPDVTVPLVGALAVAVVVIAVILVRPRLNARRKAAEAVFDDEPAVTAETHRRRAAESAARGDWPAAVVDQFRAVVRSAEERAIIDERPGRTADEAAAELAPAFRRAVASLAAGASLFDAVRYGKSPATADDHAAISQLDAELLASVPVYAEGLYTEGLFAEGLGPGLAVPK